MRLSTKNSLFTGSFYQSTILKKLFFKIIYRGIILDLTKLILFIEIE